MHLAGFVLSVQKWIYRVRILQIILGFLLLLASGSVDAMYSFPAVSGAPMPPGCVGSAGTYTCTGYTNIQDHVQFLDTGNVSITVNGSLNIGIYSIGSATQNANVSFQVNGLVTVNAATVHATINSGIYSMTLTGAPYIRGNLLTSTGSITARGTIQGDVSASSYGAISLLQNTVINGHVAARTGLVTLYDSAMIHGSLSTTSGTVTLYGFNIVDSWVNCDSCNLYLYGQNNTIGDDIRVANVYASSAQNSHYNGAIQAVSGYIALGTGSIVYGDITALSSGFTTSNVAVYQSVINGTVNVSSEASASVNLFNGSIIHGRVQVTNSGMAAYANNNVYLDSNSVINNSVSVTGVIINNGRINGCARTSSSYPAAIQLQWGSNTAGICCASSGSCSQTSCVINPFGYPTNRCSTPANKFNCIDPSVSNPNAANGHLFTQIANSAFNVDVVALAADNSVNTDYVATGQGNQTVEVRLIDCGDPAILINQSCGGTTTNLSTQNLTFSNSDAGRKRLSNTISNAYKNVRCTVTDPNATQQTSLSTDNFAVRPANFSSVSSSNANADVATGISTSNTPIIKAGSGRFNMTASTGLSNYNGTAKIDPSKLIAHTGAVHTGAVSGTFSQDSYGNSTGTSFSYDEVGYFRFSALGIYDDTFTQVDASVGDCVAGFTASNNKQACAFGYAPSTNVYMGRFVPDHFAISPQSVTPACSNQFSYFGQDGLLTRFQIKALNSSGVTTQNYTGVYGGFARMNLNSYAAYHFNLSPHTFTLIPKVNGSAGVWSQGQATIQVAHQVSRPGNRTPVTNISVEAQPVDDDGVTISSAVAVSASSSPFRYGRLYLSPAHGSELLPLPLQLEAQYWSDSVVAYVRSVGDSCTTVPLSSVVMKNYHGQLNACETHLAGNATMVNGLLGLRLTAPGVSGGQPNTGSVDVEVNLGVASNNDKTCVSLAETPAIDGVMPWFGVDPEARATFGIYKSPIVYMRESF